MTKAYQYDASGYYAGDVDDYGGPLPNNATRTAPQTQDGYVPRWTGATWEQVENHKGEEGYRDGKPCTIKEYGPLPAGWSDTPAPPTLEEVKADAVKKVDNATSAAILAGFDYETDLGTGVIETLHFSYDSFDQQNFADSANVVTLAMSGVEGLPESVTWNAYRNWTTESGGELVRLTLTPATFLELYTVGALTHKSTQMEIGGARKKAVEAAESVEAVLALLAQWGL